MVKAAASPLFGERVVETRTQHPQIHLEKSKTNMRGRCSQALQVCFLANLFSLIYCGQKPGNTF